MVSQCQIVTKFFSSYFRFLYLSLYRPVMKSADHTFRSTSINKNEGRGASHMFLKHNWES